MFQDEEFGVELDRDGKLALRQGPQLDSKHAAFYPVVGGTLRRHPRDLSEAQRLFLDLAFRMAVLQIWAERSGKRALLLVEAPEGTVDMAYMVRVGEMIAAFGADGHTIVVSTNLNNDAFLPAVLSKCPKGERQARILNLLSKGNPRAIQRSFSDAFERIITKAVRA